MGYMTAATTGVIISSGNTVFNEGSADKDFRIESDDNTHQLFVDAGNNRLGIGTSTPLTTVDIEDGLTTVGAVLTLSTKEPTVVDGDVIGRINFRAPLETGADALLLLASIHAEADATFDATTNSTELVFSTAAGDAAAERVRITSAGNVGIGTATPAAPLHVITSGTGEVIRLESTDATADVAPVMTFKRTSQTPADGDNLGIIQFLAMNSDQDDGAGTEAEHKFADMYARINDVTTGTEDGELYFRTLSGGTLRRRLDLTALGVVFNEESLDMNFRVESNGNANMLTVDGGTDRVGIGVLLPSSSLEIRDGLTTTGAVLTLSTNEPTVVDEDVIGSIHFRAPLETGVDALLVLASISAVANEAFDADQNQTELVLSTASGAAAAERVRITHDGDVQVSGLTASEIVITDANKGLTSAAVATYPSLAELAYVKGATSAIQTQLDTKEQVGKKTMWIPAAAMYANTTAGCSALTQVELANGPELKVLDFAAAADDHAQFTVSFPKSWNEGTVTFQPFWTVTGTNTGTVVWGMSAVACADNATQNVTFGNIAVTAAKAHSGTSNDINVSAVSAALTIKAAAVDTLTYFQIFNDTSASGQTGVARLTGVKVFFTTDAVNDA